MQFKICILTLFFALSLPLTLTSHAQPQVKPFFTCVMSGPTTLDLLQNYGQIIGRITSPGTAPINTAVKVDLLYGNDLRDQTVQDLMVFAVLKPSKVFSAAIYGFAQSTEGSANLITFSDKKQKRLKAVAMFGLTPSLCKF